MHNKQQILDLTKEMSDRGVLVDVKGLKDFIEEQKGEVGAMFKRLQPFIEEYEKSSNEAFVFNSPNSQIDLIYRFRKNHSPYIKPSLRKDDLKKLHDEVANLVVDIKSAQKIMKQAEGLLEKVSEDGRIHTTYHAYGAVSGRYTSEAPNLQNIAPVLRKHFVAGKDKVFLVMDLSQIEYRVSAQYAKATNELAAFRKGVDFHQFMADKMGISRDKAKVLNYAIAYGMTPFGVAELLECDEDVAERFIDDYFVARPEVANHISAIADQTKQSMCVATLDGTVRKFGRHEDRIESKAYATLIQGTAGDIFKRLTLKVANVLKLHPEWDAHIVLTVHDELVIEGLTCMSNDDIMDAFTSSDPDFPVPLAAKRQVDVCWF